VPDPSPQTKKLLKALKINLPSALPKSKVNVDTRKKLPTRRKNA